MGSCEPSVWAAVAAGTPARNASALCWTGASLLEDDGRCGGPQAARVLDTYPLAAYGKFIT